MSKPYPLTACRQVQTVHYSFSFPQERTLDEKNCLSSNFWQKWQFCLGFKPNFATVKWRKWNWVELTADQHLYVLCWTAYCDCVCCSFCRLPTHQPQVEHGRRDSELLALRARRHYEQTRRRGEWHVIRQRSKRSSNVSQFRFILWLKFSFGKSRIDFRKWHESFACGTGIKNEPGAWTQNTEYIQWPRVIRISLLHNPISWFPTRTIRTKPRVSISTMQNNMHNSKLQSLLQRQCLTSQLLIWIEGRPHWEQPDEWDVYTGWRKAACYLSPTKLDSTKSFHIRQIKRFWHVILTVLPARIPFGLLVPSRSWSTYSRHWTPSSCARAQHIQFRFCLANLWFWSSFAEGVEARPVGAQEQEEPRVHDAQDRRPQVRRRDLQGQNSVCFFRPRGWKQSVPRDFLYRRPFRCCFH